MALNFQNQVIIRGRGDSESIQYSDRALVNRGWVNERLTTVQNTLSGDAVTVDDQRNPMYNNDEENFRIHYDNVNNVIRLYDGDGANVSVSAAQNPAAYNTAVATYPNLVWTLTISQTGGYTDDQVFDNISVVATDNVGTTTTLAFGTAYTVADSDTSPVVTVLASAIDSDYVSISLTGTISRNNSDDTTVTAAVSVTANLSFNRYYTYIATPADPPVAPTGITGDANLTVVANNVAVPNTVAINVGNNDRDVYIATHATAPSYNWTFHGIAIDGVTTPVASFVHEGHPYNVYRLGEDVAGPTYTVSR